MSLVASSQQQQNNGFLLEKKQLQKYSTPEGLEPSLPMGNALAVRRLNRSAKVSFAENITLIIIQVI